MEKEQIDGLERRNKLEQEVLLAKLESIDTKVTEIKVISEENRRTLRGYNGNVGMVADLEHIKMNRAVCLETIRHLQNTVYGNPENSEDGGLLKDHQEMTRMSQQRLWANRAVIGAAIAIVADVLSRFI